MARAAERRQQRPASELQQVVAPRRTLRLLQAAQQASPSWRLSLTRKPPPAWLAPLLPASGGPCLAVVAVQMPALLWAVVLSWHKNRTTTGAAALLHSPLVSAAAAVVDVAAAGAPGRQTLLLPLPLPAASCPPRGPGAARQPLPLVGSVWRPPLMWRSAERGRVGLPPPQATGQQSLRQTSPCSSHRCPLPPALRRPLRAPAAPLLPPTSKRLTQGWR